MLENRQKNLLGIFAKFWEPGKVKTRLAKSIGQSSSAKLHRAFVSHLIQKLVRVDCNRVIGFTPQESESQFKQIAQPDWQLEVQIGEDLGQRMNSFFIRAFERSFQKVVLIGADFPGISIDYIEAAFDALSDNDVVLGPASDGGYVLIGLSKPCHIFEGVQWSTDTVLESTVENIQQLELSHKLLSTQTDIDEIEQLAHFHQQLFEERRRGEIDELDLELLDAITLAIGNVS